MLQNPFLNATRMNNSNARVSQEAQEILNIKDFMKGRKVIGVSQVRIANNGIPLYCSKLTLDNNKTLQLSWQVTSEGYTLKDLAAEAKATNSDSRYAVLRFEEGDNYIFGYSKEVAVSADEVKGIQKLFE